MPTRLQKPGRASGAARLRHRITFAQRALASDGGGNTRSDWTDQFTVAAGVEARFGGEEVMASRLEGRQPVTITVRQSDQTRLIDTDWKATDARSGKVYAVRSIADPDDSRAWLDILCETGVEP